MPSFIKKYISNLQAFLKEKAILLFLLFLATLLLLIKGINNQITHGLIVLFFMTYLIQFFLIIKKKYLFYLLRTIFLILIGFEFVSGRLNMKSEAYNEKNNFTSVGEGFSLMDSLIGYKFKPNVHSQRSISIYKNDTIYDVLYSSDSFGRRIHEVALNENIDEQDTITQKEHTLFFGCSFVFGEGLKFTSTIPYLFEENNKEYKSYNYGFQGYGPHQMCLFYDNGINTLNNHTVKEKKGFALYTYIHGHLSRVYGGSSYLRWGYMSPDVFVVNDQIQIKKRSKLQIWLADFLRKSETTKLFNIDFSYPKTKKFYKRFADIINYMAKKYWQLKPGCKFYVGIYPGQDTDLKWIDYLDKRVIVIKVNKPADFETNGNYYIDIKHNQHPSEMLNSYFVKEISKSIKNN